MLEATEPGTGTPWGLIHLPSLLLCASALPCSFCCSSYIHGHQKLLHFKLSVLTTPKQTRFSSLSPKCKMPVEGTSGSCFSLGARFWTEELCQGTEVPNSRPAVRQQLGWGRRAPSPKWKGCFADLSVCPCCSLN